MDYELERQQNVHDEQLRQVLTDLRASRGDGDALRRILADLAASRGDPRRWQELVSLALALVLGELDALRGERS